MNPNNSYGVWQLDNHGWSPIPTDEDVYTKRWYRVARGGYQVVEVQHTGLMTDRFEARVYDEVTEIPYFDADDCEVLHEWAASDMLEMEERLEAWMAGNAAE